MGKRNGLLRFWGALALCLCLCTGALAESLQGYTVAEKLIKQLDAGSGFSGTLEVQKGGTMRGNIEHTGGELSSNGKVLHTHKHPGDSGGTTGGPI